MKKCCLSYEYCLRLKELGYDEWSDYMYTNYPFYGDQPLSFDDEMELRSEGHADKITYDIIAEHMTNKNSELKGSDACSCVLMYDAIQWLGETYEIHFATEPHMSVKDMKMKWSTKIISTYGNTIVKTMGGNAFENKEDSLIDAIQIAIKRFRG